MVKIKDIKRQISDQITYYDLVDYLDSYGARISIGDDRIVVWLSQPTDGFSLDGVRDFTKAVPDKAMRELLRIISGWKLEKDSVFEKQVASWKLKDYSTLIAAKRQEKRISPLDFLAGVNDEGFDLKYLWQLEHGYLVDPPSLETVSRIISALDEQDTEFAKEIHEKIHQHRKLNAKYLDGRIIGDNLELEELRAKWSDLKREICKRLFIPEIKNIQIELALYKFFNRWQLHLYLPLINPDNNSTRLTVVDDNLIGRAASTLCRDRADRIALVPWLTEKLIESRDCYAEIRKIEQAIRKQEMAANKKPAKPESVASPNTKVALWQEAKTELFRAIWPKVDIANSALVKSTILTAASRLRVDEAVAMVIFDPSNIAFAMHPVSADLRGKILGMINLALHPDHESYQKAGKLLDKSLEQVGELKKDAMARVKDKLNRR